MSKFIQNLIAAINSIESQPWAFMVLIIGCVFLIACRHYNEDTNIASGIIGCATGMFSSQMKQAINAQHVNTVNQQTPSTKE